MDDLTFSIIRITTIVGGAVVIRTVARKMCRRRLRRTEELLERANAYPRKTPATPAGSLADTLRSMTSPAPTAPARAPVAGAAPTSPRPQQSPPKRQTVSLDLDAGLFKPLSDAEAKRRAAGVQLWGNPFFGRRDLIPPASDQRTLLIDRAMVGHGLITPEELQAIHRIGEVMDRVRPDLAHAQVVADNAVKLAKEERQRLREQKKAEAAERKRLHAVAVAKRKATDIIFLGRGVSKGLADRTSDAAKLQVAGLAVLSTPADVAAALKLPIPRLRWLAFHSDAATVSHYVRFTVPKKGGGVRNLAAPHDALANAQLWILENILEKVPVHAAAHGFVIGRSTVTNAKVHVGRAVVVNTDLTDFFQTITFPRVLGIFRQLGYSPAVSTVFALLCTEAPRRTISYAGKPFHVAAGPRALPQGACTSPALSNLAARRLDSRLTGIATKMGWTYTRYADDLTLSAPVEAAADRIGYMLARVRHIAQDEGFAVNEKKTRVQRRSTAQRVTGIVVNERPGVPRETARRLRAILHRAKAEGLDAQNREKIPHFRAWLGGMIAYVSMVNPQQGKPLLEALNSLS